VNAVPLFATGPGVAREVARCLGGVGASGLKVGTRMSPDASSIRVVFQPLSATRVNETRSPGADVGT
jgi:hypothetical protein